MIKGDEGVVKSKREMYRITEKINYDEKEAVGNKTNGHEINK